MFVVIAMVAHLSACAPPLKATAIQIKSSHADLRREASLALPISADSHAPVLNLRENISESIESLAADGTARAYKVEYFLFYKLPQQNEDSIVLEQIISVSESRYLAGRRARADAANRLRQEALRRMLYILTQYSP